MKKYISQEYRALITSIRSLGFKESFMFISVALITFVSMYYASPNFFRKMVDVEDEKFYSTLYWFSADGFLMFVVPVLLIYLVLKDKPKNFGFAIGDVKFGIWSSVVFLVVMLPILWLSSGSESFARSYPQGGVRIKENMEILLYYEFFVGFYMLAWEFFWRGYMLFGLKEKFGYYAIFIQMIPFFILHRGKPEIEVFSAIIGGLILGIQAYRARSFLYCFLVHWIVNIFNDTISVLRYKSQSYGIGIDSFIKLFFN